MVVEEALVVAVVATFEVVVVAAFVVVEVAALDVVEVAVFVVEAARDVVAVGDGAEPDASPCDRTVSE